MVHRKALYKYIGHPLVPNITLIYMVFKRRETYDTNKLTSSRIYKGLISRRTGIHQRLWCYLKYDFEDIATSTGVGTYGTAFYLWSKVKNEPSNWNVQSVRILRE